jgi:hypothetical protein
MAKLRDDEFRLETIPSHLTQHQKLTPTATPWSICGLLENRALCTRPIPNPL